MAWTTPKTDWTTNDGIAAADLNRIEENTKQIKEGLLNGGTVASANSLNIGADNGFFILTGGTPLRYLTSTGRRAGSMITLKFAASTAVHTTEGSPAVGYAEIHLINDSDRTYFAGDLLLLVYDGTYWSEVGRA
jgi:hypothetical protein